MTGSCPCSTRSQAHRVGNNACPSCTCLHASDRHVSMRNRLSQLDSAGWRVTLSRVAPMVRVVLGEENAVPLMPKLGIQGRLACRVGGEAEAVGGLRRPVDGCVRQQELTGVALRIVVDLTALRHATPLVIIGERRRD